jgi:hypothetical protein
VPALLTLMASAAGVAMTAGAIGLIAARRARHYRRLAEALRRAQAGRDGRLDGIAQHPVPPFAKSIAVLPHFLTLERFEALRQQACALAGVERSYVPTHKKGGTIAYETIIARAPAIAALYHAPALQALVSRIVGVEVGPTPLHDQSSLSILVYDRPGDHIGWHFDHDFYRGRHFTVLLPLVNRGAAAGGLSHARLWARIDTVETPIETAPNTLVLFEGAKVLHKVAPIETGERRVVVSMTYCDDPRSSPLQTVARRFKDTAFYGIRALWT